MKSKKATANTIENSTFKMEFDPQTGAITSFFIKPLGEDLIGEKRLATLFNLRLQHPDYECDYTVENRPMELKIGDSTAEIFFEKIRTERGEFPVSLRLWVELDGAAVRFRSRLENRGDVPVAEFWFPCLGGITRFGERTDTEVFWPGYVGTHYGKELSRFPTGMGLGDLVPEVVRMCLKAPWPSMPWFDLYNKKINAGLYFGYHDPVYRIHASRFAYNPCVGLNQPGDNWPTPELLGSDDPIGVNYSFIRFPYISKDDPKAGEVFEAGEFVIQFHDGDWHQAAPIYRTWWDQNFSVPEKPTWLRERTCWLGTMLLQPEDRINTDYKGVVQWAKDARELGINTVEICAWDKGGQDRDYPEYVPDERLGGEAGFRHMLQELKDAGIDPVIFANYNTVNCETELYKNELHRYRRMDEFGNSENWMHWGQSTIQARHALSVRRQLWASASIPRFNEIIAAYFVKLAGWGVRAMQWDKTGASEQLLDFNPLSTLPPDTSMPEGTVRSCEWLLKQCREIQPDFAITSEAVSDRYLSYMDVFYRAATGASVGPMRYLFPEWTSCIHVSSPFDYAGINSAVRFGCVLQFEPQCYKASPRHPFYREISRYIGEINRLREELKPFIFLARWLDDQGAELTWNGQCIKGSRAVGGPQVSAVAELATELPTASGEVPLCFSVHERFDDQLRSLVVVNTSREPQRYRWRFTHASVTKAILYAPFEKSRMVSVGEELMIAPERLHVLIEEDKK